MTPEAEPPQSRTPQELDFAAAVKTLLDTAQAAGITQGDIAKACHFHPSKLSKWKNATLIPTQEDLDSVLRHLADRGHAPQDIEGLRRLRQQAKDVRLKTGTQRGAWEEKLAALRGELSAMTNLHRTTTAKLDDFRNRLTALDEELSRAMARAAAAENERDRLHHQTQEQGRQLAAAAAYSRQVENELAGSRYEVQRLRQEIGVLQHQVQLLHHDAQQAARSEVADPSMQVSAVHVKEVVQSGPLRYTPGRRPTGLLGLGISTDRARRMYVEWRHSENNAKDLDRFVLALFTFAVCAFPALLLGTSFHFLPGAQKSGGKWMNLTYEGPVEPTAAEWTYTIAGILLFAILVLCVANWFEGRLRRRMHPFEGAGLMLPTLFLVLLGDEFGEHLHLDGLAIALLRLFGLHD
ncbi:hypothetical protein [Streptomyces hydrogenans]|uniref:hypothetical protein n=1 Tax=Streptomyces hydrogenans TaxID=1873719 RepID=UPI0035DCA777